MTKKTTKKKTKSKKTVRKPKAKSKKKTLNKVQSFLVDYLNEINAVSLILAENEEAQNQSPEMIICQAMMIVHNELLQFSGEIVSIKLKSQTSEGTTQEAINSKDLPEIEIKNA